MIRGGLRQRLVVDSVRVTVIAALTELGWFSDGRAHKPLRYQPAPAPWQESIEPNLLAITAEIFDDDERALGGEVEDRTRIYIDIYGENQSLSFHVARDVRDILEGRIATGARGPVVDVYDFRQATPSVVTTVEIENVLVDRAQARDRAWQENWFMVRVDVLDDYGDEFTEDAPTTTWTEDLRPAWEAVQLIEVAAQ